VEVVDYGFPVGPVILESMAETLQVQCCIAGGGPAGMMLGYLLDARESRPSSWRNTETSCVIFAAIRFTRRP